MFNGVRSVDKYNIPLQFGVRQPICHCRRDITGSCGLRATDIPMHHLLLGRPATFEEHGRHGNVQSDGRLIGFLLHDRFDCIKDGCVYFINKLFVMMFMSSPNSVRHKTERNTSVQRAFFFIFFKTITWCNKLRENA